MRINLSSISSSSAAPAGLITDRSSHRRNTAVVRLHLGDRLSSLAGRLPCGVLYAFLFIVLIHACFCWIVYPHPLAREDLRRKVVALTEHTRPALIIAGDSRVECAIDPIVLAGAMNLESSLVVNIAVGAGSSSMAVAAFREFGDRFSPNPIVVVSISPHNVSSRGELHERYNAEYYWSIGLVSRFRELSVKDAVRATFAPERRLLAQLDQHFHGPEPDAPFNASGYRALDGPPVEQPGHGYAETIARLDRWRCFTVGDEESTPWRQLREDFEELRTLGAQVVVLDAPDHPGFLARLSGTPQGANYARFRATLARVCRDSNIPFLQYTVADIGAVDPDRLFWDGVHLNAIGAEMLSKRVAVDIEQLLARGTLRMHSSVLTSWHRFSP